jgi:predicted nucleotidyltransferase
MHNTMTNALMAELLGGAARYRALRCLYEHPQRVFGTRELASNAGIDPSNASRWLNRWSELGLVQKRTERGFPVYQASKNPTLAPLAQLLQQDSHVSQVLAQKVKALDEDIESAAIFGSTARGEAREDSDIDLLLLTNLPQLKAQALFKSAGRELGRPVNVLVYTPDEWNGALERGDPLAREIAESPLVVLKGGLNATEKA